MLLPTDARLTPFVEANRERIEATLVDWLRIPSISAHPDRADDVRASAEFTAALAGAAGLEHIAILDTPGAPSVYADWLHAGPDAPTVVVYGHHDVQPVDPVELWESPPFDPAFRDGECLARGAIDDKGQVLYELEAVRGLLEREGRLPVNLKFLIEGEEEVGSPNFAALLEEQRDRLATDLIVVSDTGMLATDVPSTCVAMRGLVAFDVEVRTARGDLHSGLFGGAVPNAARISAEMAAALHDADGKVTLPGFYDAIRPLSPAEQASLAAIPFDAEAWMAQAGVTALAGESGRTTLERIGARPTAEIVGIRGGYAGDGMKTIVPAVAGFKVALRLVPDQDPGQVSAAFTAWVDAHTPPGATVKVTPAGAVAPAVTPVDHPAVGALVRVLERIWGRPPLFTREGGSGPEEALGRILGAPVLFLGVGLPDDRIHAPNERMVMDQFWRGLVAAGELWHELARLGRGAA